MLVMLNRDQLKTGSKPAPGELALVQALVNTLDLEANTDDVGDPVVLKAWLVRFGLLGGSAAVAERDWQMMMALRESLRQALMLNNGETLGEPVLDRLNHVVSQFQITVAFRSDGRADITQSSTGIAGAAGQLLVIVAQAIMDGSWTRLKVCSSSSCRWAFYDSSKNQSGRWCTMSVCGSRLKARQYRKRRSERTIG